jgi:surface polysaccharide O-acyltransferase-like enzyme
MISGALLLSSSSNPPIIDFYKKRMSRLLPPIVFWTLVYVVFRGYTESTFDLAAAARSIIQGAPYYHLWYIYMMVGLYLAAPFLRQVVTGIDPASRRFLIEFCFAIAAVESALGGAGATFLPGFLPFIGYFLAGHYLLSYHGNLTGRVLVSIYVACGSIVAAATGALLQQLGPGSWNIMYSFVNPVVIVMSLCVFLFFTNNMNARSIPDGLVRRIAPITLGIYLVHPLWVWLLARQGVTGFMIHPVVGIPVTTLLAFALSAMSAALLASVPGLKRTVC